MERKIIPLLLAPIVLSGCRTYVHRFPNTYIDDNVLLGYEYIKFRDYEGMVISEFNPLESDGYVMAGFGYGCFTIPEDNYVAEAKMEVIDGEGNATISITETIDPFFSWNNKASIIWNETYKGTYEYSNKKMMFDIIDFGKFDGAARINFSIKIYNDSETLYDMTSSHELIYSGEAITGYIGGKFTSNIQ